MKPIQSLLPAAHWCMKVSLFVVILFMQIPSIRVVDFTSWNDVLPFSYVLSALLLVCGGFLHKSTLTIFASAVLFLLTCYFIYQHFDMQLPLSWLIYLWPLSVALFYLANGNE
ncbi:MAG: hypothetical protein IAE67_02585 [Candidatus Competibacteraceae bacterium]|nr:hypothetical protein [Candidatus Competibacteraceae bacterium]